MCTIAYYLIIMSFGEGEGGGVAFTSIKTVINKIAINE